MNNDYRSRPRCAKYYTPDEMRKMLEFALARSERDHLFILLVYLHGLRSSEAIALRRMDVTPGYLAIRALKGGKSQLQPIFESTDRLFDEGYWLRKYTAGLHSQSQLFDFTRDFAYKMVVDIATSVGVPKERCGVHAIRHSIAQHSKACGCGIATVQKLLRHRSIASTGVYFQESDAEAMAKVHAGLRQQI